jgi:hypothetical protein
MKRLNTLPVICIVIGAFLYVGSVFIADELIEYDRQTAAGKNAAAAKLHLEITGEELSPRATDPYGVRQR